MKKWRRSACIETLYGKLPFLNRFRAAKEDGFDAVEFWSWADKDLSAVKAAAEAADITICGFNGDAELSLVDPGEREAYLAYLDRSMEAARFLGAPNLTIHSNGLGEGGRVLRDYQELSDTVKLCTLYGGLEASAALAEKRGVTLNLEPLNVVTDHPGNFLTRTQMAAELIQLIGSARLRVLYDVYHMQLNEGCLCGTISRYGDTFGHVHVADAPGRHQPGTGEIAWQRVYAALEEAGYDGLLGYELFPTATTREAVQAILMNGILRPDGSAYDVKT